MHPTTAFAAPYGFVGWTIPSPPAWGGLPSSLYTFLLRGLARDYLIIIDDLGFPEFGRIHLKITLQAALL